QSGWRDRELRHTDAGRALDGVGDCCGWGDDRRFAGTSDAKGMAGIRNFYDDGFDHGQIEAGRHSVVEEARVPHLVLGVEEVFFIERPTDSLDRASLHLSLDIAWMHGLAGILNCRFSSATLAAMCSLVGNR